MDEKTKHEDYLQDEMELSNAMADEILEEDEKDRKKLLILLIIFLIALIFLVSSVTFALIGTYHHNDDNIIQTGSILFSYDEKSNGIEILNAYPTKDEIGKQMKKEGEYFKFNISVGFVKSKHNKINYQLSLVPIRGNTLSGDYIRVYLTENGRDVLINNKNINNFSEFENSKIRSNSKVLLTRTVTRNTVNIYVLKMWLSEDYKVTSDVRTFRCKIGVDTY